MKVNAEDFRRVYQSMNDDALLAVKRDELVEVAQQVYDAELASRGLDGPGDAADPESGIPEPAAEAGDMVEVASFTDVDDARMARDLLKAAEIPCYLENRDLAAGNWIGQPGLGGFRLSVPPDFVEQAQEVLDTEISDEELAAQAEAAGVLLEEDEAESEEETPER